MRISKGKLEFRSDRPNIHFVFAFRLSHRKFRTLISLRLIYTWRWNIIMTRSVTRRIAICLPRLHNLTIRAIWQLIGIGGGEGQNTTWRLGFWNSRGLRRDRDIKITSLSDPCCENWRVSSLSSFSLIKIDFPIIEK